MTSHLEVIICKACGAEKSVWIEPGGSNIPAFCSDKCRRLFLEWMHNRHHGVSATRSFSSFYHFKMYLRSIK